MWREVWWEMAKGVKSEYEKIKATDVFEFWNLFNLWQADLKKESARLKAQAAAAKRR
jgi:hypothetical protein